MADLDSAQAISIHDRIEANIALDVGTIARHTGRTVQMLEVSAMVALVLILALFIVIPLLSLVWGADSRHLEGRANWPTERRRRS
jgi:hypothetical protein